MSKEGSKGVSMPDDLNEQIEFENHINSMNLDQRSVFNAKGIYGLSKKFDELDKKFDDLSEKFDACVDTKSNKVTSAVSGGVTGGILAIAIALIEYFKGH
jgi:hypothetical protein